MPDDEDTVHTTKWLYVVGGGMLIGMAIGSVFGITVLDNMAIGAGIGMIAGLAVGSAIHALKKR